MGAVSEPDATLGTTEPSKFVTLSTTGSSKLGGVLPEHTLGRAPPYSGPRRTCASQETPLAARFGLEPSLMPAAGGNNKDVRPRGEHQRHWRFGTVVWQGDTAGRRCSRSGCPSDRPWHRFFKL